MMKFGKLSIRENVTVYAELVNNEVILFVPKKKSKIVSFGNTILFRTASEGKKLHVWGDNPGIMIAIHQKLLAFIQDDERQQMKLPVNGQIFILTKAEAVCLEHDIYSIAEELKRRMVEKTIRGIRTIKFAEDF